MKYLAFLLVIALIFASFIAMNQNEEYLPTKGERLVNVTLAETAKRIKEKYHMRPCGAGSAMHGGPIRLLTLCFNTNKIATKEELRTLLIQSAQELVDYVTKNEEIQPFLKVRPFTIANVQIIIYNHDKNGNHVFDPNILTAEISHGILTYDTIESEENFRLKNEFKETYDEALKILKNRVFQ